MILLADSDDSPVDVSHFRLGPKTGAGTLAPLQLGPGRRVLLREPKNLERLAEAPKRMAAQRP
jgi:hypothetical protein